MEENVLRIKTNGGGMRVMINDDPDKVIVFDPDDVVFAERFYALMREFDAKQEEYRVRSEALDAGRAELDGHGLPVNLGESLAFLRDVCEFMRSQIDFLFGEGTSQKAFGDALSLTAIDQFLEGITDLVQQARGRKIEKYSPRATSKGKTRRVMK